MNRGQVICGIQQIGIGVADAEEAFRWYKRAFGMDIKIFDDKADASLMRRYTGGQCHRRRAILVINLQGGAGFEIWQYLSRKPTPAGFHVRPGDYGIDAVHLKAGDVKAAYRAFRSDGLDVSGEVTENPGGVPNFFVRDPFGNAFQIFEDKTRFAKGNRVTGGLIGCTIGVADIETSRRLYSDILGYDRVVYDQEGAFRDFSCLETGGQIVRRVLLRRSRELEGPFSRLFGHSQIELVESRGRAPNRIWQYRLWGDMGFIHLCFEVKGMTALKEECDAKGFAFRVDSAGSFMMGEAAGRFSYIEDPDSTLIEFVETYKIPIIKKLGWHLDVQKYPPDKPLPNWVLKALKFNRTR